MSLNAGDIPDFGSLMPKNPKPQISGPPRNIDLSKEDESSFNQAKKVLLGSSLSIDSLFSLFNEWQSDKTKSIKRFVLSVTFLLILTLPAGVNITEVDLFGVEVGNGMDSIFLISILVVLVCSFAYYDYLRRKGQKLHDAEIDFVKKDLEPCLEATKTVDEIVRNNNNVISAEKLFKVFRDPILKRNHYASDTYKAIKFYERKLKKTKTSQDLIDKIEFYGMYLLGFLAIIAIADDLIEVVWEAQKNDSIQTILGRLVTYFLIPF